VTRINELQRKPLTRPDTLPGHRGFPYRRCASNPPDAPFPATVPREVRLRLPLHLVSTLVPLAPDHVPVGTVAPGFRSPVEKSANDPRRTSVLRTAAAAQLSITDVTRIVARSTEAAPVRRILNHMGEATRPPWIAPARGPPLWEQPGFVKRIPQSVFVV
jgi:hypothetical protein